MKTSQSLEGSFTSPNLLFAELDLIVFCSYYVQREKKLKKIEIRQNQEDNKELMQEELVRRSLQKVVLSQEAQEKARRIKNSTSRTSDQKDDAKSKAIDMLVDVQKQLLDVFAIAKVL